MNLEKQNPIADKLQTSPGRHQQAKTHRSTCKEGRESKNSAKKEDESSQLMSPKKRRKSLWLPKETRSQTRKDELQI